MYQVIERGEIEVGLIQSEVEYVYLGEGKGGEDWYSQKTITERGGMYVCMCTIRVRGYESAMGRCLGGRGKRKDILQR